MTVPKAFAVTAAGLLLAGCGTTKIAEPPATKSSASSTTANTTAPPPPSTNGQGLKSNIIDITFPPGSTNTSPEYPDMETWKLPLSQAETETYLKERLPIGRPASGVPWCSQSRNKKTNNAHWDWSDANKSIAVDMTDGKVIIGSQSNDGSEAMGRDGCEGETKGSSWGMLDQEDNYIAQLQKYAERDGYTLPDRKTLIEAGDEVCDERMMDESLISASATIATKYGLTAKQAQAVGTAAVEILCPEHKP